MKSSPGELPPNMMRGATLAALTMLAGLQLGDVAAQTITDKAERDEVTHMSREEPAMRAAFQKARATLDDFFKVVSNPPPGAGRFALKVAISDAGGTEYFWVNQFQRIDEAYVGTLNNEPRLIKGLRLGQRIQFKQAQIVDWTYVDESQRRMMGNFTACALLSKEPPDQARQFMDRYGLRCD